MQESSVLGIKDSRTAGDTRFLPFFDIVQKTAAAKDSVFFLDSGEGRELETPQMSCEDLSGWLVPRFKVSEFEPRWRQGWNSMTKEDTKMFCFARWKQKGDTITVVFD